MFLALASVYLGMPIVGQPIDCQQHRISYPRLLVYIRNPALAPCLKSPSSLSHPPTVNNRNAIYKSNPSPS
jgi:hypothetical protein